MSTIQVTGTAAPPLLHPEALQVSRIAARVNVSASVAQVMALLAFGAERRGDHGALASITAERVGASISRGR